MEACYRVGKPLPARFANSPTLGLGLEFTWAAFHDLSTCRPIGFGIGPISWQAIMEYGVFYEVSDLHSFAWLMRTMDRAFLEYHSKEHEKKAAEAKHDAERTASRKIGGG